MDLEGLTGPDQWRCFVGEIQRKRLQFQARQIGDWQMLKRSFILVVLNIPGQQLLLEGIRSAMIQVRDS
jgi:hypothetical protein